MATYGMKNVEITEGMIAGTTKTYLVYADTERFGEHEIMAQFPTKEAALEWLKENGIDLHEAVMDMLTKQIGTAGGRVQIANAMYRRLYIEKDGHVWGYSKTNSWTDLDRYFKNAVVTGENTAKTRYGYAGSEWGANIKFGNACTW